MVEKARYRRALVASVCIHAALFLAAGLILARVTRFGVMPAPAPDASILPQMLVVQFLPEPEAKIEAIAPVTPAPPPPEPPAAPRDPPPPPEEEPPLTDSALAPIAVPEDAAPAPQKSEVESVVTAHAPVPAQPVQKSGLSSPEAKPALLVPPRYLDTPSPVYPAVARRKGLEGLVLLEVRITGTGEVEKLSLLESSTHKVLDDAAMSAVKGWRFHPARLGGVPVAASSLIPIRFQLEAASARR